MLWYYMLLYNTDELNLPFISSHVCWNCSKNFFSQISNREKIENEINHHRYNPVRDDVNVDSNVIICYFLCCLCIFIVIFYVVCVYLFLLILFR